MFRRLCTIQSQILCTRVAKHTVHCPNGFCGFLMQSTVRKKSDNISLRSINSIEKVTQIKLENDPNVIELEKALQCTKSEAIPVYVYFTKKAVPMDLKKICKTVKWLQHLGAESSIILQNYHLFSVDLSKIHICMSDLCIKNYFLWKIIISIPESLKKSHTKLEQGDWKQFIDFMPLLSINDSKLSREVYVHEIRERVYLFSEYFSVRYVSDPLIGRTWFHEIKVRFFPFLSVCATCG